eukprot:1622325-Pleurochrysis_carterae.AAC.1
MRGVSRCPSSARTVVSRFVAPPQRFANGELIFSTCLCVTVSVFVNLWGASTILSAAKLVANYQRSVVA